jgi:hypothetical protein
LQPKSICFWPGYARDPDRLAQGAACWRRHPHEAAELVQANDSAIGAELFGQVAIDIASKCPRAEPCIVRKGRSHPRERRGSAHSRDREMTSAADTPSVGKAAREISTIRC